MGDKTAGDMAVADCEEQTVDMVVRVAEAINRAAITSPQPGIEQNLYFQLQAAKAEIGKLKAQLAQAKQDAEDN